MTEISGGELETDASKNGDYNIYASHSTTCGENDANDVWANDIDNDGVKAQRLQFK